MSENQTLDTTSSQQVLKKTTFIVDTQKKKNGVSMWTMEPMLHSSDGRLLLMWATFKGEAAEAAASSLPPHTHPSITPLPPSTHPSVTFREAAQVGASSLKARPSALVVSAGRMRSEQLDTHASVANEASQEALLRLTQSPEKSRVR